MLHPITPAVLAQLNKLTDAGYLPVIKNHPHDTHNTSITLIDAMQDGIRRGMVRIESSHAAGANVSTDIDGYTP